MTLLPSDPGAGFKRSEPPRATATQPRPHARAAQATWKPARTAVDVARGNVNDAMLQLSYCRVLALVDGLGEPPHRGGWHLNLVLPACVTKLGFIPHRIRLYAPHPLIGSMPSTQ